MRGTHLLPAARALTILRLLVGGVLLVAGASKMAWHVVPMVSLTWQQHFPARLADWLAAHPAGIAAAVVRDLLLPHGALFAALLAWFQLLTGALLLIGLFTRIAAFFAGGVLALLAVVSLSSGGEGTRFYVVLGAIALALLIGDAGQTFGMDAVRRQNRD